MAVLEADERTTRVPSTNAGVVTGQIEMTNADIRFSNSGSTTHAAVTKCALGTDGEINAREVDISYKWMKIYMYISQSIHILRYDG